MYRTSLTWDSRVRARLVQDIIFLLQTCGISGTCRPFSVSTAHFCQASEVYNCCRGRTLSYYIALTRDPSRECLEPLSNEFETCATPYIVPCAGPRVSTETFLANFTRYVGRALEVIHEWWRLQYSSTN